MTNTEVREKLVELLSEVQYLGGLEYQIADRLIAEGVTINVPQKPIEHKVDGEGIRIGSVFWRQGTTVYRCPKCCSFISRVYDYCHVCGQQLEWSHLTEPQKEE